MPPLRSQLDANASTSNVQTFDTASVTLEAGRLYLIGIVQSDTAPEQAVSSVATVGGAVTFAQLATQVYDTLASNVHRLSVFWVVPASTVTAAIRITLADAGTGCAWILQEYRDINPAAALGTPVTNGINAQTSIAATPGALASNRNHQIAFGAHDLNSTADTASGTNWASVGAGVAYNTPATGLECAENTSGTASQVTFSGAGSADRAVIAVEVKAAPIVSVAGVIRHVAARLRTLGIRLGFKSGPVRMAPRLLGAALATTVALSGTVRVVPRLPGATLTDAGAIAGLQGTLRQPQRARTTGITLGHRASPVRVVPRLPGSSATVKIPIAELRGAVPRLFGQLSFAGPTASLQGTARAVPRVTAQLTTRVALSGTLRSIPRTTGPLTTRVALEGTVRAVPRATGTLLISGSTLPAQRVRVIPRLLGAELSTTFSAAECIAVPRAFGQLATRIAIRGTCITVPRLRGFLTIAGGTPVALAGTLRQVQRLTGQLGTKANLAGTVRIVPRASGRLQMRLAGTVRVVPRLTGRLTTRVALLGTVRVVPRLLQVEGEPGAVEGRIRVTPAVTGRIRVTPAVRGRIVVNRP